MKRKELALALEQRKTTNALYPLGGDYHDADTVYDVLYDVFNSYGDPEDEIESIDDLEDAITEQADSCTPIYNKDRAEWFGENWMAYDEIAEELGRDGMGADIMQGIGVAYCLTLERDARNAVEMMLEEEGEDEENHNDNPS